MMDEAGRSESDNHAAPRPCQRLSDSTTGLILGFFAARHRSRLIGMMQDHITCVPPTPGGS
jgi:hypothetical protein